MAPKKVIPCLAPTLINEYVIVMSAIVLHSCFLKSQDIDNEKQKQPCYWKRPICPVTVILKFMLLETLLLCIIFCKWHFHGVVLVRTLKVFYYCVHKKQDTKSEDMFLLGLL